MSHVFIVILITRTVAPPSGLGCRFARAASSGSWWKQSSSGTVDTNHLLEQFRLKPSLRKGPLRQTVGDSSLIRAFENRLLIFMFYLTYLDSIRMVNIYIACLLYCFDCVALFATYPAYLRLSNLRQTSWLTPHKHTHLYWFISRCLRENIWWPSFR